MIRYQRQIETIEKQGKNKFSGKRNAKTMRGWITGQISSASRKDNMEMMFVFQEILNAYNYYEPEKIVTGEIQGWKGKSGITNIQKLPDKVIVTRFQRPNKDEEPKEVIIEIQKHQLIPIINFLNKHQVGDKLKTKNIAMYYSGSLELGHKDWDSFFADRPEHNLLTNMLGFLDSEGLIKYSGGVSEILTNELSFQLILNS